MFTKNFYRGLSASLYAKSLGTLATRKMVTMKGIVSTLATNCNASVVIPSGTTENGYPSLNRLTTYGSLQQSNSGIIIGSGITPPSLNDYALENRITTPTSSSIILTETIDDNDGVTIIAKCTITNSHTESITISEIGIFSYMNNTVGDLNHAFLIERTVLDTPVTIEAGGVGIVDYSIKFKYPTE